MDNPTLRDRAKQLRRDTTPAEAILWKQLRAKRFSGYKFRRQQPIAGFIADFFCAAVKLIVELDGDSHLGREVPDATRQAKLESLGYRVVRFLNSDVYDDLEMVLENIWAACSSTSPAGPSHRSTGA